VRPCRRRTIKIEIALPADVYVNCETCDGARYNRETLEILYRGKTIADVLDMPISEALGSSTANRRSWAPTSKPWSTWDWGTSVSDSRRPPCRGRGQRVKLATELARRPTGHTSTCFDEPPPACTSKTSIACYTSCTVWSTRATRC